MPHPIEEDQFDVSAFDAGMSSNKVEKSKMLSPTMFPEEKFTESGERYYYTRTLPDGTEEPITNKNWSLKDLAYPLNVPFGGKRQGGLEDWAFTSWLVNQAPSQLAAGKQTLNALKGKYFYRPPVKPPINVTPSNTTKTPTGNLQSKEGALQTRISQFQAGSSKSTRDLGLTTDYAKGSTLKKAITERDRARQAGVGEFSKYVDPSDTYFTPQGPYELKSKSTEQMIPSIQRDLFKVIANPKSTESDIRTALNTKAANSINPEHLTFSIDDIVNQGFGKQLGLRQGALATQQGAASRALAIRDREAKKPIEERTKGGKRDSLKGPQKNLKTNVRSLKDIGSLNLLTKSKDIFKMNRKGIKNELVQFKIGDKEWHHTIFGNKEGGALFLNKVAQDPVVAINLMAKLKSLDLPTSGTVDNLALIEKLEGSHGIGHNKLHNVYRDLGLEQGGPLDFADLMDAVAESYLAGDESAINHFFTLLDVYKERTAPYLKEQTIKSGGVMFKDTGVEKLPEVQQYKPKTEKWRDLVSQTQLDVALNGFAA
jgi:hypothetical protein